MERRNRKWLCLIAAAFMFLSGICLEFTRANALLLYPSVQTADGSITSVNRTGIEEQLCTAEMLGVRVHAGVCQRINRMNTQKRGIGCVLHVLYPDLFSDSRENCFIYSQVFPFYYPGQDIVVIKYIHQSDGKKRNESLMIVRKL